MKSTTEMDVQIRWLIRKDLEEVLRIENASFSYPWDENDFKNTLCQKNCIGFVAECDQQVVGYMLYEFYKDHIKLLNLAVSPRHRGLGVAGKMIDKLKDKLSHERRHYIETFISEKNLDGHLFFKAEGFIAVNVHRNFYDLANEDAYEFAYHL